MDPWTALGIFLLGAAIGALLTAIAYTGQIRELKARGGGTSSDKQQGEGAR